MRQRRSIIDYKTIRDQRGSAGEILVNATPPLEDDVVIQESREPFNLMRNIPLEVEEIEDWMNK